jgi:putative ABC transport system permease protein
VGRALGAMKWVGGWLRRRRLDAELDEELATHLAEAADDYRRRGLGEEAARLAAIRDFGGVSLTRDRCRDVRGCPPVDALVQDVRDALRVLRKTPGFAAAAIATLALGIGANSAIFSVLDAVMLRSLPVRDPRQLVVVGDPTAVQSLSWGTPRTNLFSFPLYREVRDHNRVFSSVLASGRVDNLQIGIDGGGAEDISGRLVTGNYFETLGVEPFLGRTLTAAEDRVPGGDPYVVISYAYWQRRFGGDPSAIGRTVRLKNYPFTIVGVAPPEFFGEVVGDRPDVWAPMMMVPQLMRGREFLDTPTLHALLLVGRLRPGVTIARARADVAAVVREALTQTLASQLSADDRDAIRHGEVRFDADVSPGARGLSRLRQQFSVPLLVLTGMVALVLLVACVNVAHLMLARAAARRREIAMRLTLGAGPGRIVSQFLAESIVLAAAGGALALPIADWGAAALVQLANRGPTADPLMAGLDWRVVGFTAAVCVVAGLAFGLAPALAALRADVTSPRDDGARTIDSRGAAGGRASSALLSAQVAFGVAIVMAAGVLVHSLRNLHNVDLGYRRNELVLATVDLRGAGYTGAQAHAVTRDLLERLSTVSGVRRATASANGLFNGSESAHTLRVEGFTPASSRDLRCNDDEVAPEYFATLGVPIIRGRDITPQDFASAARVVVVNETFARFYFGDRDALGRKIFIEDSDHPGEPPYAIVGIARDVRDRGVRTAVPRRLYAPLTAATFDMFGDVSFEIRASARPDALVDAIRRAIASFDRGLAGSRVRTVDVLVGNSLSSQTIVARLTAAFGALVLILICVGLYGSLSYRLASRTTEIGVRMALGAPPAAIVRMVARESGVMLAVGTAVGVPIGIAATGLFRAMLFEVAPSDPWSIAAAAAAVVVTAVAAAILPARRATSVDPALALKYE